MIKSQIFAGGLARFAVPETKEKPDFPSSRNRKNVNVENGDLRTWELLFHITSTASRLFHGKENQRTIFFFLSFFLLVVDIGKKIVFNLENFVFYFLISGR